MKRRELIRTAVTAGAGALVAGCAGQPGQGPAVHTQPQIRWRLASTFPRSLDTIYDAAELLSQRLEAMSDGRFQVRPYPAGELVPGLQVLDAVQQGTVQVGQTASYYFTGKNPALAFDTCVPFGLTARQQLAWLRFGGGIELMREVFADFGILNFVGGNTGVQMGGWFRREIGSAADLQGLKMRIPGLGGEVMSRLGVTVQVLAGGEIFPALERGAIDATEWVGPYDDEKLGFHKVAQFYYYPGWWEPGPALSFLVHKSSWDKLPSSYQAMFEAAAAEAATGMLSAYDRENPPAFERLLAAGVQLRPFPQDLLQAADRATREMHQEQIAAEASYRKVFEAWDQFRKQSHRWFGTAELSYAQYAAETAQP
jgi:TRAP-type mannitol/chloroaromatic compound transport system substrate-binding protein